MKYYENKQKKRPSVNTTTCHGIHGMHWNDRVTTIYVGISLTSIFVNDFH